MLLGLSGSCDEITWQRVAFCSFALTNELWRHKGINFLVQHSSLNISVCQLLDTGFNIERGMSRGLGDHLSCSTYLWESHVFICIAEIIDLFVCDISIDHGQFVLCLISPLANSRKGLKCLAEAVICMGFPKFGDLLHF